ATEAFDSFYDEIIEKLGDYCRIEEVNDKWTFECKCPYGDDKVFMTNLNKSQAIEKTFAMFVMHVENTPDHVDKIEREAYKNYRNSLVGGEWDTINGKKPTKKGNIYYNEVIDELIGLSCNDVVKDGIHEYKCHCNLGDNVEFKASTYNDAVVKFLTHIENTPDHNEILEKVAQKKYEKANYKNEESTFQMEYQQYRPRNNSQTIPREIPLKPMSETRSDEKEDEKQDSNYMSGRRRAETHHYAGQPDTRRNKAKSPYYISRKANYGHYSEEEKEESRKDKNNGRKIGNEYGVAFDSDAIPEKAIVRKLSSADAPKVLPTRTINGYRKLEGSANPAVENTRGEKPKDKKRQLVRNNPEIYGVDEAGNYAHN
ncbi:MAG: hypothetical protein QXL94_01135, partial [Candidatus Parvarchaeum sp.]